MYCCVPGCRKRPGDRRNKGTNLAAPRLSFHKLPSDPNLLQALIIRIKRDKDPNFRVTHHTRICSQHYTPEDFYVFNSAKRELRPGVLPSIFNFNGSLSAPQALPMKKDQKRGTKQASKTRHAREQKDVAVKLEPFLDGNGDDDESHVGEDLENSSSSTKDLLSTLGLVVKTEEPQLGSSLAINRTAHATVEGVEDDDYGYDDGIEFVSLTADQQELKQEDRNVVEVKIEDHLDYTKPVPREDLHGLASDQLNQSCDPLSQRAVKRCISPEGIRKHAPKPCKFCGAVFRTKNEVWKAHMKMHLTDKEHLHGCTICGKYFFSSYVLMRHKQAHMERLSTAVSQGQVVKQSEKATSSQSQPAPKKVMKKFRILVPVELLTTAKPQC